MAMVRMQIINTVHGVLRLHVVRGIVKLVARRSGGVVRRMSEDSLR